MGKGSSGEGWDVYRKKKDNPDPPDERVCMLLKHERVCSKIIFVIQYLDILYVIIYNDMESLRN